MPMAISYSYKNFQDILVLYACTGIFGEKNADWRRLRFSTVRESLLQVAYWNI